MARFLFGVALAALPLWWLVYFLAVRYRMPEAQHFLLIAWAATVVSAVFYLFVAVHGGNLLYTARSRRGLARVRRGRCPACGYRTDMSGGGRCSECGFPPIRPDEPLRWPHPPPLVPWPRSVRSAQRLYVKLVLSLRPPAPPEVWSESEAVREAARTLGEACASEFRWPNSHFLPGDAWSLVILGQRGRIRSALQTALGVPLTHEQVAGLKGLTFGEVAAKLAAMGVGR